MDLSRYYEILRMHGYRIDTRGIYPILVKGQTAQGFETFADAVNHAITVIYPLWDRQ